MPPPAVAAPTAAGASKATAVLNETTDETVEALLAIYRELAHVRRTDTGFRRWNAVSERLPATLGPVLADPDRFAQLRQVAESDPDPLVREFARADVEPLPSSSHFHRTIEWLRHPAIGVGELSGDVLPALRFAPVTVFDDEQLARVRAMSADPSHYDRSWLGGQPLGPLDTWPLRDDGIPLVHIGQADLRRLAWARDQQPGVWGAGELLPSHGVLQVFHDLETPGDAGDERRGAWLVRWVEEPTETRATPPPHAEGPTPADWPVELDLFMTMPPNDDVPRHLQARREQAGDAILRSAMMIDDDRYLFPPSLFLGHGSESAVEARRRLDEAAGPGEGAWVLLFDFAGAWPLDEWFGDLGHLEVWIREPDLTVRNFGKAWALLR
jgi:hypothetical protein